MMSLLRPIPLLLCLSVSTYSGAILGQSIDLSPLAMMTGQIHAAAQACQSLSAEQLQVLKDKQKSEMLSQGISAQTYEQHFNAGYDKAQTKLKSMPPPQKQDMCAQLQAMKP